MLFPCIKYKTTTKQVWLYFIRRTAAGIRGHYATTNLPIVLNTQTDPYLIQATQKNTCQTFLLKEIPKSKISNPKKFFHHPRNLKSGVPPGLSAKHRPYSDQGGGILPAASLNISSFSNIEASATKFGEFPSNYLARI